MRRLFALQMWALHGDPRAPLRRPRAAARRLRVRYPIGGPRARGSASSRTSALQRAFSRPGEVTKLDRVLAMVHWAWFIEPHLALAWILLRNQGRFPRAAPADGRRVRHRLRDLLRRSDGAALVGGRGGLHRRRRRAGRESEEIVAASAPPRLRRVMVEVGGADLGSRLAGPLLLARRQPVGGDALPALRHLGAGGAAPHRVGASWPARPAGPTRSRSGSRSSTWASTTLIDLLAGAAAGRRDPTGRAARRARWRTGSAAWRSGSSGSRTADDPPRRVFAGRLADKRTAGPPGSIRGDGERPDVVDRDLPRRTRRPSPPSSRSPKRLLQTGLVVLLLLAAIYVFLPKIVGHQGRRKPALRRRPPAGSSSRSASTSRCSSRTSRSSGAWSASASPASSGASRTRSRWRAWPPPACSPRPAPAGSCSPTGRCERPAWSGARRPARMVAFLVLLYAVYMVALVVFGVLLRVGVLSGEAPGRVDDRAGRDRRSRSWSWAC